ncbi:two-component system response regulator MisR [Marinobacterium maritimum]|uniref:Two-component system response regulator MisR n=1 Tax=Marinobacterium maritimum TaxID=500162 RepID=A0ABN1I8V8_9GAMM
MQTKTLLLVDDDRELCAMLAEYLGHEGYQVETVHSGEAALAALEQFTPDLMVLDIMMPGMSGLELLQQLRPRTDVPVLMLTGRGEAIDRILGLEMGADDYLSKPCHPRELSARVKAILRRCDSGGTAAATEDGAFPNRPLEMEGLMLDPGQREVSFARQPLQLTSAEFNVLAYLMQHAGRVLSKAELTRWVLHRELSAYDRAIDVHVSRVRQKLAAVAGDDCELIKTVRGQGYQFIRSPS